MHAVLVISVHALIKYHFVRAYVESEPGRTQIGVDGKEYEGERHISHEGRRRALVQASDPKLSDDDQSGSCLSFASGVPHLQSDFHCAWRFPHQRDIPLRTSSRARTDLHWVGS